MAKGARSSTVKRNNANLRAKIFGPAVDERTARLSAKLQELISKPGPNEHKKMELDANDAPDGNEIGSAAQMSSAMDVDNGESTKNKSTTKRKSSRIEKKIGRKKPKNQVIFPTSAAKRKRIAQSKRKAV